MRHRLIPILLASLIALITLSACTGHSNSVNNQENKAQKADTQSLLTAQPVPHYDWSQIRQTLVDIEGAQASTVQTTTFFFMMGFDHPYLVCNSVGFPVASTTQLTNPDQVIYSTGSGGGGNVPISQMDPNGVYSGQSAGTYVICINQNGKAEPQYAEPDVHTVAGPAAWDTKTNSIVFTGNPTVNFKVGH